MVTFDIAFSTTPNVVVSIANTSEQVAAYGDLTPAATNVKTTGFTVRVYNGSTGTYSPAVQWIAVGTV